MSATSNSLLPLNLISKEKPKSFKIKGDEPVFAIPANNLLYVVDVQNCIFKLDHTGPNNSIKIYCGLDSPTCMQVNDKTGEGIVAKPADNSISFSCFKDADFANPPENMPVTTFNPPIKATPPLQGTSISISKNLKYIAFCLGTDIYVYTGPKFAQNTKPQCIKQTERITNIIVTDDGVVYFTTENGVYVTDVVQKKGVKTKVYDNGIQEGMAFITDNKTFYFVDNKTVIYLTQSNTTVKYEFKDYDTAIYKACPVSNYVCITHNQQGSLSLIVVDLIYGLQVFNGDFGQTMNIATHMWGALVIITKQKEVQMFAEQTPLEKLKSLTEKKKFDIALRMAKDYDLGEEAIAQVQREYGDSLFEMRKFDEAIDHYIETIRFTEPSHVIAKFVDPHHAQNLARYLQAIPAELKSKQHTTLLFNCFTKVKDEEKLKQVVEKFVEEADKEPTFDVETAVDVLKRNGYQQFAEQLAKAYKMYNLYMGLLYEGQQYKAMLDYIEELPGEIVMNKLNEYGAEIIAKYPEGRQKFIDYATLCCTGGIKNQYRSGTTVVEPANLAPIFVNSPAEHFKFLLKIKEQSTNLSEQSWNTLIELALRTKYDSIEDLLNDPNARYSREQVLIYMNAYGYDKDLSNQYMKMKLYPFLLHRAKPDEIVNICKEYGRDMPELWSDGLIAIADADCDDEILANFLEELRVAKVVPFLTVITVLRTHGRHTFAAAQNYVKEVFLEEQNLLREANEAKKKNLESAAAENSQADNIAKENFSINSCKICEFCGNDINEDSHHFLCGHSFHNSCLDNSSRICPKCKNSFEEIVRKKIDKIKAAKDNSEDVPEDGYEAMLKDIGNSIFCSGITLSATENEDEELKEAEEFLERFN